MATTTAQAVSASWKFPHIQTTVNGNQSPTTTVTVADTSKFASAGSAWVEETKFSYTSKTSTTFAGCTGLPAAVTSGDVVLPDGLAIYVATHLLNGVAVTQAAADPSKLVSSIDGFKQHNATGNTRGERWHGETI